MVSAHGAPGVVLDGRGAVLLGEEDSPEDLGFLAGGRVVYLCACRALEGGLGDRLIEAGATLVFGFTEDPAWESDEGRRAFAFADRAFLAAIAAGAGREEMESAREELLRELAGPERRLDVSSERESERDRERLAGVLQTMVIREGTEST